jgi:manganese transport protein
LGKKLGLATLIASNLLNLITCAAEIAAILHLLTGWAEKRCSSADALRLPA